VVAGQPAHRLAVGSGSHGAQTGRMLEAVEAVLDTHGIGGHRPLVVICPGAKFGASKCWPPERFAAVADRLIQRHGAAVVISPGPGEEPLARAIQAAMTPAR